MELNLKKFLFTISLDSENPCINVYFKMALMAEYGSWFFLLIFLIVCVYGTSDNQTHVAMQISVEQHQGTSQCVNTIWNTQA